MRVRRFKYNHFLGIAYVIFCFLGCSPEVEEAVDCSVSDLELKVQEVEYSDCGVPNGAIFVDGVGGRPPYQYRIEGEEWQQENRFRELTSNFYTLEIRDAAGCINETTTFVGSNEGVSGFALTTPSGCGEENGTITVVPRNGIEPYKYQLGENNDNYTNSPVFEGLASGTYSVWISDANDCFIGIYVDVLSGISWEEEIKGIIETNCAIETCHGAGEDLELLTHADIKDNAEQIRQAVIDKTMPVESSLSGEEIDAIVCWIDDGAPEN